MGNQRDRRKVVLPVSGGRKVDRGPADRGSIDTGENGMNGSREKNNNLFSVFLALHTDNALTARMPDLYVREFRLPVRRTSHNNIIRRK